MTQPIRLCNFFIIIIFCFIAIAFNVSAEKLEVRQNKIRTIPSRAARVKPLIIKKKNTLPLKLKPGQRQRPFVNLLPDLLITRFIISPKTVNAGSRVNLIAFVKNTGNQVLHNIVVRFINMNTHQKFGEKRITLGPGQTIQSTFTLSIKTVGKITIHAIVDPDNHINEANEKNNTGISYFFVNTGLKSVRPGSVKRTPMLNTKRIVRKSGLRKPFETFQGAKNDLTCSVPLVTASFWDKTAVGFCLVEKDNRVSIKVMNKGISSSGGFYVGLGRQGKAKTGDRSSWDYLFKVNPGMILPNKYIYADFKLGKNITEQTGLIAGVDIEDKIQETNEKNNYSKPFNIRFEKPRPQPIADLQCIIKMNNGFYSGKGDRIKIKIINRGNKVSLPCVAGFGEKDQVKIGSMDKWIGTAVIPKIFPFQNVYISIPCTKHKLTPKMTYVKTYIAAVDINKEVIEKNEQNNYSKPFKHMVNSGQENNPPLFSGKNFKAFNMIKLKKEKSFMVSNDIKLRWTPTGKFNNLSLNEKKKYHAMNINLVDYKTKQVAVKLASDVPADKFYSWTITLPKKIQWGNYYLVLSTPLAGGWGATKPFKIWAPEFVSAATDTDSEDAHALYPTRPAPFVLNNAQKKPEPLEFSHIAIDYAAISCKSFSGKIGNALLTSFEIKIEYSSNRPFMFAEALKPPANLKLPDDLAHALIDVKMLSINAWIRNGPIDVYPWKAIYAGTRKIQHVKGGSHTTGKLVYPKGVLPKGNNYFILKAENVGYFHGLRVMGRYHRRGKICVEDFWPKIDYELSLKYLSGKSVKVKKFNGPYVHYGNCRSSSLYYIDTVHERHFDNQGVDIGVYEITDESNCK